MLFSCFYKQVSKSERKLVFRGNPFGEGGKGKRKKVSVTIMILMSVFVGKVCDKRYS